MLACLKNQVEKYSKIENSVNNQKSKTSQSNFSKVWKENIYNMLLEIKIQTSLLLILNIITNKVDTRVSNLSHFWSWNKLVKFRNIKKHFWISKDDVRIHPSVILFIYFYFRT